MNTATGGKAEAPVAGPEARVEVEGLDNATGSGERGPPEPDRTDPKTAGGGGVSPPDGVTAGGAAVWGY